jgi:hypothetical protein
MQRFIDDDRGYLDWLDHHPDGFVINTWRTPSAAYLMLHPPGGKYAPLREHLSGTTDTRVHMTFKAIEDLVGRLPDSAYRHRAWWGNNDATAEATD